MAIDWAFVGLGVIGEEIAPLIQASLALFEVELTQAQELERTVFKSYLAGLRDASWHGNPQLARFGYTASSALRYGLGFIALYLDLMLNFDESKAVWVKQVFGCQIETFLDHIAELLRLLLDLGDEARALLDAVG